MTEFAVVMLLTFVLLVGAFAGVYLLTAFVPFARLYTSKAVVKFMRVCLAALVVSTVCISLGWSCVWNPVLELALLPSVPGLIVAYLFGFRAVTSGFGGHFPREFVAFVILVNLGLLLPLSWWLDRRSM